MRRFVLRESIRIRCIVPATLFDGLILIKSTQLKLDHDQWVNTRIWRVLT